MKIRPVGAELFWKVLTYQILWKSVQLEPNFFGKYSHTRFYKNPSSWSRIFLESTRIPNFMKIRPVGAEFFGKYSHTKFYENPSSWSRIFLESIHTPNFMKIRPVGAELFWKVLTLTYQILWKSVQLEPNFFGKYSHTKFYENPSSWSRTFLESTHTHITNFMKIRPVGTDFFWKVLAYQILWKSVQLEPNFFGKYSHTKFYKNPSSWSRIFFMRTDEQTDITKLTVAFRNFVQAPKKNPA